MKKETVVRSLTVSRELQQLAHDFKTNLDKVSDGESLGFCIVVFTEGRSSYISNCHRPEVKRALREMLAVWDADGPDVPAHSVQ